MAVALRKLNDGSDAPYSTDLIDGVAPREFQMASNEAPLAGEPTGTAPGPKYPPTHEAQGSETPRDRLMASGGSITATATPTRPRMPAPVAAAPPVAPTVGPMQPLPSLPGDPTAGPGPGASPLPFFPTSRRRAPLGAAGGLLGGGLGVAFDPTANESGNDIEGLIQLLQRGGR